MEFIIDSEVFKGHDNYLKIMQLVADPNIDVSKNTEFQTAYSGYYFPSQVEQSFKDFYFSYMQQCRKNCPSFKEILNHIYEESGNIHYSFASKLLHTINPENPVLDKHIMRLLGFQLMDARYISKSTLDYNNKKDANARERIKYYQRVFNTIRAEYMKYENEPFMMEAIKEFDALSEKFKVVSYMKKVDMLLFRLREERAVSALDYLYKTFSEI